MLHTIKRFQRESFLRVQMIELNEVPNDYNVTKTYGVFKAAKDKSSKASTGYAGQTRFLSVRSLQRMSFTRGLKCSILYC